MNVYEYAMKVEKDGEKYYRDLASKTEDPGVKSILTMLADAAYPHLNGGQWQGPNVTESLLQQLTSGTGARAADERVARVLLR